MREKEEKREEVKDCSSSSSLSGEGGRASVEGKERRKERGVIRVVMKNQAGVN